VGALGSDALTQEALADVLAAQRGRGLIGVRGEREKRWFAEDADARAVVGQLHALHRGRLLAEAVDAGERSVHERGAAVEDAHHVVIAAGHVLGERAQHVVAQRGAELVVHAACVHAAVFVEQREIGEPEALGVEVVERGLGARIGEQAIGRFGEARARELAAVGGGEQRVVGRGVP
jgi:hypothetical protein